MCCIRKFKSDRSSLLDNARGIGNSVGFFHFVIDSGNGIPSEYHGDFIGFSVIVERFSFQ